MMTSFIAMAFLMGLTGSLHCAGMCGPIMLVMPFQFMSGMRKWMSILLYHFGRISVYALLSVILFSLKSIFEPKIQQVISVVLGILLLVIGVMSFIPNSKLKLMMPWTSFVKANLGRFKGSPSPGKLFMVGILNGLLPCGLVYMALSAAVTSNSLSTAILGMYAFGLGTMPMLIGITLLGGKFSLQHFVHVRKLVPVLMLVFGVLFLLRGMDLGIPYLSPKVEVVQHEVKSSCCHKE
jgi:hypothetical protein